MEGAATVYWMDMQLQHVYELFYGSTVVPCSSPHFLMAAECDARAASTVAWVTGGLAA